jgi:PAS domain S-box-containing protein
MRSKKKHSARRLHDEVERAHTRLSDLEATMNAIYCGEVDGFAIDGPDGSRVFTLQHPDEPFRILAERMSEGVATLTNDGVILFCNRRLSEMVELPVETLLGSSFSARLPREFRPGFPELARRASDRDVRVDSFLVRSRGSRLAVQLSFSSIAFKKSETGLCLVATDLSERKRAEEESIRRRERQLQLKDELLSHVSHELRSPLTCIHQFTTILLDGLSGPLNTEQKDHLELILKSANQLRAMIDDLLEAARIEAGKVNLECGCVALPHVIEEAIEMLRTTAAEKAIRLHSTGNGQPLLVFADPHRVLQILLNLIGNALKFTPAQGWVEVIYGAAPDSPGYSLVTVRDNGCGISKSAQARIFERLYQEAHSIDQGRQGLGLGLAICKELVSSHHGKIWVESRLGQGSAFSFTLPLFSLAQILSPVVLDNGSVRKVFSLITVRVTPNPNTGAIEERAMIHRKCLELLQRCTLPDKDVVLPPVGRLATGEMFAILAATDAQGAEVLVRRIQEQVKRCPELSEHSVARVSSNTLPVSDDVSPDINAITNAVTRAVSNAMSYREEASE